MLVSKRELADVVIVPLFYRYVQFNCLCSSVSLTWLVSGTSGLHLVQLLCLSWFCNEVSGAPGLTCWISFALAFSFIYC